MTVIEVATVLGRSARPRALPLPRQDPHDRAVPPAHGEAVARLARRRPPGPPGAVTTWRHSSSTRRGRWPRRRPRSARRGAERGDRRARARRARSPRPARRSSSSSTRSCATPGIDWAKVVFFHLDEYVGLPDTHPASFRRYLRERIVERVHPGAFHFVDGDAPDPVAECRRVGALLAAQPIDVAFVGIGENGHLAFNDPPADFETEEPYLVLALDEACRRQQLGEGWFARLEDVPARAISMSIRQILKSREILAVVPDRRKAPAVRDCLELPVSPARPASVLRRAPAHDALPRPGLGVAPLARARPRLAWRRDVAAWCAALASAAAARRHRRAPARGRARRRRARVRGDAHDPDLRGGPARPEPAVRPLHERRASTTPTRCART